MQLHRQGEEVQFWSRRGVEHGRHSGYQILAPVVEEQVRAQEIILDGELVVWNSDR
jgi:ATP-dependent DNA ligase